MIPPNSWPVICNSFSGNCGKNLYSSNMFLNMQTNKSYGGRKGGTKEGKEKKEIRTRRWSGVERHHQKQTEQNLTHEFTTFKEIMLFFHCQLLQTFQSIHVSHARKLHTKHCKQSQDTCPYKRYPCTPVLRYDTSFRSHLTFSLSADQSFLLPRPLQKCI